MTSASAPASGFLPWVSALAPISDELSSRWVRWNKPCPLASCFGYVIYHSNRNLTQTRPYLTFSHRFSDSIFGPCAHVTSTSVVELSYPRMRDICSSPWWFQQYISLGKLTARLGLFSLSSDLWGWMSFCCWVLTHTHHRVLSNILGPSSPGGHEVYVLPMVLASDMFHWLLNGMPSFGVFLFETIAFFFFHVSS